MKNRWRRTASGGWMNDRLLAEWINRQVREADAARTATRITALEALLCAPTTTSPRTTTPR